MNNRLLLLLQGLDLKSFKSPPKGAGAKTLSDAQVEGLVVISLVRNKQRVARLTNEGDDLKVRAIAARKRIARAMAIPDD